MSTLRIKDAPLLPDVDGAEKIPTGGRGDYAVSVDQIKDYVRGGLPQQIEDHINDANNPHQVTKEQVGLGNVDNTSDVDKPISTATQEALELKANQSTTYTKIQVDGSLGFKADKTYVDSRDLLKADKTYVDEALSSLSTQASKFYPTLAEANADIANIEVNQPVQVGEAVNGGLWYKATAGAISLTKSVYDPLNQSAKNSFYQNTDIVKSLNNEPIFGEQYTDEYCSGESLYTSAYYVGFSDNSGSNGLIFNTVEARIFNTGASETEFRVFIGDNVNVAERGNSVSSAKQNTPDFVGFCDMPASDTGAAQKIKLDQIVMIPPNTPYAIAFRKTVLKAFSIARYTTQQIENKGFNLIASAVDWGNALFNVGTSFRAGFRLLLDLTQDKDEDVDLYKPYLVLPPKIYTVNPLTYNIYLEHLVCDSHHNYNFDFTCARGSHRSRGWLYSPISTETASSSIPVDVKLHDKQNAKLIDSKSSTLVIADKNKTANVQTLLIGSSSVNSGVMTQHLLDLSVNDTFKVGLIGSRGQGGNLHEGRGGWTITDYTGAGRTYYKFDVSGVVVEPAINATNYSFVSSGVTKVLTVQEVVKEGNVVTALVCSVVSGGTPPSGVSGVLTKQNSGIGDNEIAFSNVQQVSGNPFWDGSGLNFQSYLNNYSFNAPNFVLFELGVNDVFNYQDDALVEDFANAQVLKLDQLIASIQQANSATKVGICTLSTFASQDAFGIDYACAQNSWRAKRNVVILNKVFIEHYSNKEGQNIFVVGSGLSMDTENNYPESTIAVNAYNEKRVPIQTNAVHSADAGYKQRACTMFAFMKAVY